MSKQQPGEHRLIDGAFAALLPKPMSCISCVMGTGIHLVRSDHHVGTSALTRAVQPL